jgi:hypothetical protein
MPIHCPITENNGVMDNDKKRTVNARHKTTNRQTRYWQTQKQNSNMIEGCVYVTRRPTIHSSAPPK